MGKFKIRSTHTTLYISCIIFYITLHIVCPSLSLSLSLSCLLHTLSGSPGRVEVPVLRVGLPVVRGQGRGRGRGRRGVGLGGGGGRRLLLLLLLLRRLLLPLRRVVGTD